MTDKTKALLILGAGRLARDVAQIAADCGAPPLAGFVEGLDRDRAGQDIDGLPIHWIGDVAALADSHCVVSAIGDPARKRSIAQLEGEGFAFPPLVHPTAHVAGDAKIGAGALVGPMTVLASGAAFGGHVFANRGALVGHDTRVGDFCTLGPGVNIAGGCTIGDGSTLGIGAVVIDGIKIGAAASVAAGALVTKDVAAGCRVGGAPARRMPARAG